MYTHYWTPNKVTNAEWKPFLAEVKQLVKALPAHSLSAGEYYKDEPLKICGWNGKGLPTFNNKKISFNGDASNDLDHETFSIEPEKNDWNFCKTARKPYDLLVCAVLLSAHNHLNYEVSSDGDLEDWQTAIDFYGSVIYDDWSTISYIDIVPDFLRKQLEQKSI